MTKLKAKLKSFPVSNLSTSPDKNVGNLKKWSDQGDELEIRGYGKRKEWRINLEKGWEIARKSNHQKLMCCSSREANRERP